MGKSSSNSWQKRAGRLGRPVLAIVAVLLVAYGSWGLIQWFMATHNPKPVISDSVVRHSTDQPDETPPGDACKDYRVAARQPRKLELPSLGISGCIQRVGIDEANRIAVPPNIHLAGWFVGSSVPGDKGVSIVNGHVQGYYQSAIFKRLNEVRVGETVRVQFGDATERDFTIVSVDSYDIDRVATEQFRRLDGIDKQLTLITCGGFDRKSQTYQKRILVRAKLKAD